MTRHPPAARTGTRPAEGHDTRARPGLPLVRGDDPGEPPPRTGPGVLTVHRAPRRDDPTPLPEMPPHHTPVTPSVAVFGQLPAGPRSNGLGPQSASVRSGDRSPVRPHGQERPGHVVADAGSHDGLRTRAWPVRETLSPALHHVPSPVCDVPPSTLAF